MSDNGHDPITVLTLMAGRFEVLEPYLHALEALDYPKRQQHILWYTNTPSSLFVHTLHLVKEAKQSQYASFTIVHDRDVPHAYETVEQDASPARQIIPVNITGVAELYNRATQHRNSQMVFSIEDDEVVPSHSLKKLAGDFAPGDGFVSGVVTSRHGSGEMHAFTYAEFQQGMTPRPFNSGLESGQPEKYIVLSHHQKPYGLHPYSGAGLGCVLLDMDVIEGALGKPVFKWRTPAAPNLLGCDTVLGYELIAKGVGCKVDYDVRPYHIATLQRYF